GRAADNREVDHPVFAHRLDRLVGEAALPGDRAHAVALAERVSEKHHARGGRRADADLLVLARRDLAQPRRGVQPERAAQVPGRFEALVEDADVRAVADADDVTVGVDLVADVELADLLFRRREAQALRTRGHTTPPLRDRCARSRAAPPSTGS